MYHTAACFEGKKSNEMIMNKLQNVAGLRDSQSEKRDSFDNFFHKVRRKVSDLKDGVKAATA
jgi:hypothetical protein